MDFGPRPDLKIVKAGVLDGNGVLEGEGMRPQVEQFTSRRPSWLWPVEGSEQENGQQAFKGAERKTEDSEARKSKL